MQGNPRVGETFRGSIVAVMAPPAQDGTVMLRDLAIEAQVNGLAAHALGDEVTVELIEADPARRITRFRQRREN